MIPENINVLIDELNNITYGTFASNIQTAAVIAIYQELAQLNNSLAVNNGILERISENLRTIANRMS